MDSCKCTSNKNTSLNIEKCNFKDKILKKIYCDIKSGNYDNTIHTIVNSFKYYKLRYVKCILIQIRREKKVTNALFLKYINEINSSSSVVLSDIDYIKNMNIKRKDNYVVAYILRDILFEIPFDKDYIKEPNFIEFRKFLIDLTIFILIEYLTLYSKKESSAKNNIFINSAIIQYSIKYIKQTPNMVSRTLYFDNSLPIHLQREHI